jgi:acyl carrier protein
MVPSVMLWLDEFPRTPNGKIDRKNLPEPGTVESDVADSFIAPQNETQQKVRIIWSDLLGLDRIGIQDDFFSLGGHSLLMIQLVSRLRQAFNFSIPLGTIVDARTVAAQAARIDTLRWNRGNALADPQAAREEFEV